MTHYLQVTDAEGSEPIEVPTEEDGTLPLSSLTSLYPGVAGLKYTVDGHTRAVRLSNGKLLAPEDGWGNHLYYCFFPKESGDKKRKADDSNENGVSKSARTDSKSDSKGGSDCKWTYTDLVVLGLPWKTNDKGLHDYFSQFGELQMSQVKIDPVTKRSKGFGFIRFVDNEVQVRVMLQRHQIDGRWCDVRVPLSKDGVVKKSPCKIFIGQCTEDMTEDILREYFIKFGDISDVYVPKPFRGFAFVTFVASEIAQDVCSQQHVVMDKKIVVTEAIPKSVKDRHDRDRGDFGGGGYRSSKSRRGEKDYYGGGGGGGGGGGDRYYGGGGDYSRRRGVVDDKRDWRDDYRHGFDEPSWKSKSPSWNHSHTWADKPTPDPNLNSDLVAKAVNKAVLGVIENLKSGPPEMPDNWYSRR